MQTKTYFAASVPAALEVARKELGPDAVLVSSRPSPSEARAFGRLEVTFGFDSKPEASPVAERPVYPSFLSGAAHARIAPSELDELRQQIAALRAEVGGSGPGSLPKPGFADYLSAANTRASGADDQRQDPIVSRLRTRGLESELARELASAVTSIPGDRRQSLIHEISGRIRVTPFAEMKGSEIRTLAFVGPPGRGKTTSLVKIAVKYGLARRVPVRLYSAGAQGVGCQEQMARYAAILGVPFHACESLESLHLSLNGDGWKGLVLIDTPGISPAETAEVAALSGFFARRPDIERHLVLRADARAGDMVHMVTQFSGFGISCLLFTGLDEAKTPGAMVEALIRSGLPAGFSGTGQQIPDDMEEPNAVRMATHVCGDDWQAAAAA